MFPVPSFELNHVIWFTHLLGSARRGVRVLPTPRWPRRKPQGGFDAMLSLQRERTHGVDAIERPFFDALQSLQIC